MNAVATACAGCGSDLAPDRETRLAVIGRVVAGRPFEGGLGPGEAVRIMTGGVMPPGADTVVLQEVARVEGEDTGSPQVIVPPGQETGQNRRCRGEDLAAGRPALPAGKRLGPAEVVDPGGECPHFRRPVCRPHQHHVRPSLDLDLEHPLERERLLGAPHGPAAHGDVQRGLARTDLKIIDRA